jgi:hypothetical protein
MFRSYDHLQVHIFFYQRLRCFMKLTLKHRRHKEIKTVPRAYKVFSASTAFQRHFWTMFRLPKSRMKHYKLFTASTAFQCRFWTMFRPPESRKRRYKLFSASTAFQRHFWTMFRLPESRTLQTVQCLNCVSAPLLNNVQTPWITKETLQTVQCFNSVSMPLLNNVQTPWITNEEL